MFTHFPLLDEGLIRLKPVLDRVFKRYDMGTAGIINFIDQGGNSRRFADACGTAVENQAGLKRGNSVQRWVGRFSSSIVGICPGRIRIARLNPLVVVKIFIRRRTSLTEMARSIDFLSLRISSVWD